ncbi:MAG: tetratricopeptide repeat protein [Moraxellaceae bacterium]|nr:MAG: tetratricopeptide repeat protein [Moraxellaceae bacterium]
MASFLFSKKFMHGALLAGLLGATMLPQAQAVPIEQGSLTQSNNSPVLAGSTAATDTQGSSLWQLYQQVQQLQQEVRELRGQLESQQNSLDRTQKEVKNRYTDLDQRLEMLKEQTQPTDATDDNDSSSNSTNPDSSSQPDTNAPASNDPANSSPNNPPNNPASDSDPAPTNATPPVSSAPATPVPSRSASGNTMYVQQDAASSDQQPDKQAYISAYDAYKAGGAAKAIKPMQQFIASFPNSVYVPNAYYWLGEFYLASNPADFVKAKKSFNEVINKYPKSAKASTALYRVATITQEIDKRTSEAKVLMKKLVRDYSGSTEAQYARSFIAAHP